MKKTMQISNKLLLASGAALFLMCATVGATPAQAYMTGNMGERAQWQDSNGEWQSGPNPAANSTYAGQNSNPNWADRHARWERRAAARDEGRVGPASFRAEDRAEIRGSIASAYRLTCPQGNSRTNTSVDCMQPWQDRADFIGQPVSMTATPISSDLASRLSPPPSGYHYAKSGTDVMLVNDNGQISDVVTLHSAMNPGNY